MHKKFRVWNKKRKEWAHSVEVYSDGSFCAWFGVEGNLTSADSKDGILMQHAGCTDKNGKDVYEDDIIYYEDFHHHVFKPVHRYLRGVVKFGKYKVDTGCEGHGMGNGCEIIHGFYLKDEYGDIFPTLIECKDYEYVAGNIHENPELLKVKNENS